MMMFVVRGARYGLRGMRVGEASHPGPRLRRLRRVSSTHHDRGADDVDPTMRDSDDDAPLVLTRADMPQSVQDLHEVASDDEGEGHDESIPVFVQML